MAKPAKKRQRTKAYQWLLAVENILQQYTGQGFNKYLPPASGSQPASSPYSWPWLGIALDRGPDSWAAKQFLKYHLHANVEEFPDQSHDCWNDVRNALRATGLWNHVLLMVLALNLSHAPFEEGKWHSVLCDAFQEYYRIASSRDALFLRFLPKILADWRELHRLAEPNIAQDVWDRLPEQWCWKKRGSKVGMCRFFGFVTSSGPYQRIYHTKLLVMVYLGIQQGWLSKQELAKAAKKTLKIKDPGADKKQSMKESNKQVGKLFGYGNGMQLVTVCKLEPDTYFYQSMVILCTKAISRWHSEQNKTLRSCSAAGKWFMSQAVGGFLVPICETFSILWDAHPELTLQMMGFKADQKPGKGSASSASSSSLSSASCGSHPAASNDPEVILANMRAEKTLIFTLHLAGNRIKRCFWAMRGWPAQSCLLGHKDPEQRASTIDTLKADFEGYNKCKAEARGFFGRKDMSVFETRSVQQVVQIMQAEGWKDTEAVQEWARRKYSSLIQTQIIEDGFQRERMKEHTTATKSFNEATAWHTLIKKKVLAKVHKFKSFPLQPFKRGVKKELKQKLYHPSPRNTSCNLKDITTGKTAEASWWTCTSSTWNAPFAHLVLQEYCLSDLAWPTRIHQVSVCWLCCVFQSPLLLVRRRGTQQWHFALGTLAEVVGIAWPACGLKDAKGKVVAYLPQKDAPEEHRQLITLCPLTAVWPLQTSEYEAMTFKAQSPEAVASSGLNLQAATSQLQPASGSQPAASSSGSQPAVSSNTPTRHIIIAVPTSDPEPILKAAARLCFSEWGIGLLKNLAGHLNVDLLPADKLIDILKKLLNIILAPLQEQDLLHILSLREYKNDPFESILQSEDMVRALI
jgi:hypothetical protein